MQGVNCPQVLTAVADIDVVNAGSDGGSRDGEIDGGKGAGSIQQKVAAAKGGAQSYGIAGVNRPERGAYLRSKRLALRRATAADDDISLGKPGQFRADEPAKRAVAAEDEDGW